MESNTLHYQIVESICSPELVGIGEDFSEVVLDSMLDDGVLQDIPVVGTIVKVFKGAMDIRDRIFIAKVARFLFGLSRVPLKRRQLFKEKMNANNKFRRKLGSTLILLLDRLDDIEKPDFVAFCFIAYLNDAITFETFRRVTSAIDIAFLEDLKGICRQDIDLTTEGSIHLANLSRTPLVEFKASGIHGTWNDMGSIMYSLSPIGQTFVEIVRAAHE
jgi:hypothetical protein